MTTTLTRVLYSATHAFPLGHLEFAVSYCGTTTRERRLLTSERPSELCAECEHRLAVMRAREVQ